MKIRTRKQSGLLLLASFVVFVIGAIMLPNTEPVNAPNEQLAEAPQSPTTPTKTESPQPEVTKQVIENDQIKFTDIPESVSKKNYDVVIHFPVDKYPDTAAHIEEAIKSGESTICTIDRAGADENREESLEGVTTKVGYDRDEWPMAMCAEGGDGANIEYVKPSDNRGAGSWVGNKLEAYTDGTRVLFVIDRGTSDEVKQTTKPASATTKPTTKPIATPTPKPTKKPTVEPKPTATPKPVEDIAEKDVYYANCTAVRAAGADPIYKVIQVIVKSLIAMVMASGVNDIQGT